MTRASTAPARSWRSARAAINSRPIVESLVKSTREMRETNKALEERLSLSKTEISNLSTASRRSAPRA
jgi:diguanylate cyclase